MEELNRSVMTTIGYGMVAVLIAMGLQFVLTNLRAFFQATG
jgi:hypothetical protein